MNKINTTKDLEHMSDANQQATAIESIRHLSGQTKELVKSLSEKAQITLDCSNKEKECMNINSDKIQNLKQKMQTVAELTLDLSNTLQQIKNNLAVVEDISEQTNMLALNAAVEAARAGEHGKGFAVVAGEIRKLADESKQATNKISSLINEVQNVTNSTVMATEEGSKEIEIAVKNSNTINTNLEEIVNIIKSISENVYRITTDTQTIFSSEFNSTILEFNDEISNFLKSLEVSTEQLNETTESDED